MLCCLLLHQLSGAAVTVTFNTSVLAVRRVEDFDLHKRLYQGKASLLYSATCKKSQIPVAVKVYRKARLSELNWYQVQLLSHLCLLLLCAVRLIVDT